jgi:uncharacterized protein
MVDAAPLPQAPLPREPFFRRISPGAFVILSLAIIFVLYQVIAGVATFLLFNALPVGQMVAAIRIATVVGQILCILVPTVLLVRARYGSVIQPMRLGLPSVGDMIAVAIGLVALQQLLQCYMIAQDAIPIPPEIQKYVDMFKSMIEETYRLLVSAKSPVEFMAVLFTVGLVPAVVEELLFRGLVQRDLEKVTRGIPAAVITGVIFGAYHMNPFSIVPLVVLGVFFGFVVHRTQNLTLSMMAHFLNNFIACCTLYFGLGEDYLVLSPGAVPDTQTVVLNSALSAVVFVAVMYYFVRSTAHE